MIYVLSMVALIVAAFLSLRATHTKETKLVLSTTIARPAAVVYPLIGKEERVPIWRRSPFWLPSPLRITLMSAWGELTQARTRKTGLHHTGTEEICVRHLKNREFGYRSVRRHDLSFESTFRLTPGEGECLLTWEIRYRVCRLPDILGKPAIEAGARASMSISLALIERLALGYPATVSTRELIHEARRDQISAA